MGTINSVATMKGLCLFSEAQELILWFQECAIGLDDAASVCSSALDGCKLTASSLCTGLGSHTQWDPWLAPRFTSHISHQGRDMPPRPTTRGLAIRGATTSHDLVNVVHLSELDSLLSHPQARLDHCCRQRRLDRLLLRSSDVSDARLVLTSHVLHGKMRDLVLHCLAIKLLIWTVVAAAASGCFCRVLIVALILTCFHPLRVRSFHPLWVRSSHFFHSGARQSSWDFSLFSSVCRAVHDVLSGELFACVQHAHSRAARGLLD